MKKLLLMKTMLLLCALIVGSTSVWADNYTWTTASGQLSTSTTSFTVNEVTWSFTPTWSDNSKKYVAWIGGNTNCYQIGSSKNIMTALSISTSGISGTITSVQVRWSSAAANNSSLAVSVGNSSFTSNNATSSSSTIQNSTYSGSGSGMLTLSFTCTTGIKIQSVTVTYTTGGGSSTEPSVSLSTSSIDATVAEINGTINVTYNNLTEYISDVFFCESDGTTSATYDWLEAEINSTDITKLDYAIDANTGAARTAYMRVYVVDNNSNEYYSPIITITQAAKTVNLPTFNLSTGTFLEGTAIELSSDEDGNTIRYNITTNGTEPSTPTKTTGTLYESPIILSGNCTTKIKAIAVDAYGNVSNATTRSYTVVAPTPTDLPFNWAGGGKDAFNALPCVFSGGLGGDYDNDHSPYLIKFDTDNDYIMIFTNSQPGKISIGVKMIGGATTSTIKVQEGTTGTGVFTDVEDLTISGKQNAILNLSTTNAFATTTRVIKLLFVKGSNVGVGPISIALPEPAAPVVSGSTITLTTTTNMAGWRTYDNNTTKKYTVDGTTKVFYASAAGENKVTLSEIEGGVPANTTVILHQTSGTSITLTETDNAITAPASNMLAVSTANQNLGTVYRLGYKSTNGVGFYTYTSASAPAGIIYIATVNSARDFLGFAFEDEDVTAIESVKAQKVGGQYFNLAGQRVAQPTRGLYIVNGKKVVIK